VSGDSFTVTSADGNASVTVPRGALPFGVSLSKPVQDGSPPADPTYISGTAYDFEPSGTVFNAPVTISIGFMPSNLPAPPNETLIEMGVVQNNAWVPLSGTSLNNNNTAMVQVSHFTAYGVLGQSMVGSYTLVSLSEGSNTTTCPGSIMFSDGNADSCTENVFNLNSDGSFTLTSGGSTAYSGTWSMDGDVMTLNTESPSQAKDTFRVTRSGTAVTFTRLTTTVAGNEVGEVYTLTATG
jgi:hypothetical protein